MTIAFQGVLGAYSEEATRCLFPEASLQPLDTFEAVFASVESGGAERAVVPIENAVFGSVSINYDHLRGHAITIVGEVHLRIHHHLMAPHGATPEAVRRVRSHPQALGQCRASLQTIVPHATTEVAYDTAGAARDVAEQGDPSVAAIASRRAADRYGLSVLAAGLEDDAQNYTRFLALAPEGTEPSLPEGAAAKTSVAFTLRQNVPGALFKSLAVFALRELDLLKIESRPLVGYPGRYVFYLDVAAAAHAPAVHRALSHLGEITTELKVLGTYLQGERRNGADGDR